MTKLSTLTEATITEAEAVTLSAKAALSAAKAVAKRSGELGTVLTKLREATEANGGTFRQYVKLSTEAIRSAGDWTMAPTDIRKAVAAVAGTTGGLSSVMVAEAVGLSQATASRAIRAAKAEAVTMAGELAGTEAYGDALADGLTEAEATEAADVAKAEAVTKAEREAAKVITRSGLVMTSGRESNGTVTRKGRSVAASITEAVASLESLADGTVTADELRELAVKLAEAAEHVGRTMADTVAKAEAEARTEAEATEAAKAEAKAARQAEREAKAAELATRREAKRVRPVLALVMGNEAVANLTDAEAVAKGQTISTAATLALTEATA